MSKRKLKKGKLITTLDELVGCKFIILREKRYHAGWFLSWPTRLALMYVSRNEVYEGVYLTNDEYYAHKTDEQILENLGDDLCSYCSLDESHRGVHGTPNGYWACEGRWCDDALENWKECEVE